MKDTLDKYTVTIPRQIKEILKKQLLLVVVFGFLGLFLILQQSGKVIPIVTGVIMTIVYIVYLYSMGYEMADHDIKSFSVLKPYWWKGFAMSISITGITIILAILYFIFCSGQITNIGQVLINFIFIIWIMPFYPIVVPSIGELSLIGFAVALLIPVIFIGLGYIAGKNQFDLSVILNKFIYEDK